MNQSQAFAAAAKLLGVPVTKVGMQTDRSALTGDERLEAIEAAKAARATAKAAAAARDAKREAILAADAEYQSLKKAAFDAYEAEKKANWRGHSRRVTVLRCGGMFNEIVAEGDNFDDAIAELKRKKGGAS